MPFNLVTWHMVPSQILGLTQLSIAQKRVISWLQDSARARKSFQVGGYHHPTPLADYGEYIVWYQHSLYYKSLINFSLTSTSCRNEQIFRCARLLSQLGSILGSIISIAFIAHSRRNLQQTVQASESRWATIWEQSKLVSMHQFSNAQLCNKQNNDDSSRDTRLT